MTSSESDMHGGQIGFAGDFEVYSWSSGNNNFDIVEHYDTFGIDSSGNVCESPT